MRTSTSTYASPLPLQNPTKFRAIFRTPGEEESVFPNFFQHNSKIPKSQKQSGREQQKSNPKMEERTAQRIKIVLGATIAALLLLLLLLVFCFCRRRNAARKKACELGRFGYVEELEPEELVRFPGGGGEDVTIQEILDAPGEVVGKSSYGTLYKAVLQRSGYVALLRFLRPACAGRTNEILPAVQMLGLIRHPNLVSLQAFYSGPRGEKLLVHPFFGCGNLWQFLRGGSTESHRWSTIYKISLGIAKGLDHLHTGLEKPIIHGSLKLKNILLNSTHEPYISDFGLHLLLNPTTGQEMLETLADEGYKAPELIKMKDASTESDIYGFGVILLELLTRREPIHDHSSSPLDHLPNYMRNAILDHRVMEMFSPQLLRQCNSGDSITIEGLLMFFQLAISCCSPSPSLRPDTKQIIRKLNEIGE